MAIFRADRAAIQGVRAGVAAALLGTTALAAGAISAPGTAQAQAARSYEIPAGPLAVVLNRFAEASGIRLFYDSALTNGISSPGLKGSFGPAEGLSHILAGTGLTFRQTGPGAFTLERAPQSAEGAIQLGPVRVEGDSESPLQMLIRDRQADSATAAEGYRAMRARVAGFTDKAIVDTPFSVTVVPRELLANQAVSDLGALDRSDASVTTAASNPGLYPAISLRGLSLGFLNQNYRYNGLRIVNVSTVGLESKERVEILKGLSALQAGFSSPGGVINYVSKRPGPDDLTGADFSVNQFGDAKVHADISRSSADGTFGVRVNGVLENQQSFVQAPSGVRTLASAAIDWWASPDTLVQLDFEHERRNQPVQSALEPLADGTLPRNVDPRTFTGLPWLKYPVRHTIVAGRIEQALGPAWSFKIEGNMAWTKGDQNNLFFIGTQGNGDTGAYLYSAADLKYRPRTLQATVTGMLATGPLTHEIVVGGALNGLKRYSGPDFFDYIGETNIYQPVFLDRPALPAGPSALIGDNDEKALFLSDAISVGEIVTVHLGGRYAWYRERQYFAGDLMLDYKKSKFTPSVALVVKPVSSIAIYANYVEGLERGGVAPAGTTNANAVMPPILSKQYEAGIKVDAGTVTGSLAAFQIERPAEFVNGDNSFVQSGGQKNRGVEASLIGKLSNELAVFSSAMFLDAKFGETGDPTITGMRPSAAPRFRVALNVDYTPSAVPGLGVLLNFTHAAKQYVDDANLLERSPAYSLVNLGIRYETELGGRVVTFRLNADNLFDTFYWANSQYGTLIAGAPRTVTGGIGVRF